MLGNGERAVCQVKEVVRYAAALFGFWLKQDAIKCCERCALWLSGSESLKNVAYVEMLWFEEPTTTCCLDNCSVTR